MKDLKRGQVIFVDFPHPSFKWANGLKVVDKIVGDELYMYALNDKGEIESSHSITGINNEGIKKTNLTYKL